MKYIKGVGHAFRGRKEGVGGVNEKEGVGGGSLWWRWWKGVCRMVMVKGVRSKRDGTEVVGWVWRGQPEAIPNQAFVSNFYWNCTHGPHTKHPHWIASDYKMDAPSSPPGFFIRCALMKWCFLPSEGPLVVISTLFCHLFFCVFSHVPVGRQAAKWGSRDCQWDSNWFQICFKLLLNDMILWKLL